MKNNLRMVYYLAPNVPSVSTFTSLETMRQDTVGLDEVDIRDDENKRIVATVRNGVFMLWTKAYNVSNGRTASEVLECLSTASAEIDVAEWCGTTIANFNDGSVIVIDGPTVTVL